MHVNRCLLTFGVTATLALLLPNDALARNPWGHSPHGHGGYGGYGGGGAAAARAARADAIRKAKNAEQQYAGAIKARKEGNVSLAATLYMRLALAKPKNRHSDEAKKTLASMADEGRAEMKKADALLESGDVEVALKQLDKLANDYETVPNFNHEIAEHVQKLHKTPKYKAVLNEPQAADLIADARKYEADDEAGFAYLAYEEAAKLVPAPSAKEAEQRLNKMKKDPKLVAEAETCAKVQECLRMFHTAELLKKSSPGKAEEMFKKILANSPASAEVHRCASEELTKLHGRGKKAKSS
jgi:tetratricopeptide (TPR) repeat protein